MRAAIVIALSVVTLFLAPNASAACLHGIGDPAPGYLGSAGDLICGHQDGEPVDWTVPPGATDARFALRGADDGTGILGGAVRARLPVTAGQTFLLEPSTAGEASRVSLDGIAVLVAAGGNGKVANYVAPGGSEVEALAAGGPAAPTSSAFLLLEDGDVSVSWSTIRKAPSWCVVPALRRLRPRAARALLDEANCSLEKVSRKPTGRRRWNRVIRQSEKSGAELPPNSPVELIVGRRP